MTACPLILTTLHHYYQTSKMKMVTFWTVLTQKGLMIIVNGTFQHQVVHLILPFQLTRLLGLLCTSVTVTGNGFDPISTVAITFGGSTVATVTPTSSGGFTATFNVPLSSSIGDQTVKATQGSNSASKTFTVTALVNPIIVLDPYLWASWHVGRYYRCWI